MEKGQIVREFLNKGVLLSRDMLESINDGNIGFYLEKACPETIVLSPIKAGVHVEIWKPEIKSRLAPEDFHRHILDRYNLLRDMIAKKTAAISINTARRESGEKTIIGVVKETTSHGFVIEDPTGEMEVMSTKGVAAGDVIGVTGQVKEGLLLESGVTYPDVPMIRDYGKADLLLDVQSRENCLLLTDRNTISEKIGTIALLRIKKSGGAATILALPGSRSKEELMSILKKRYISTHPHQSNLGIIEPVPDVLIADSPDSFSVVYKGVLIVSPGSKTARINLQTKEVEFVDNNA
ncbi:MAG: hypothetical protein HY367_00915 [Candidatus Aenigmarchaeota archaeon]|nr:hypothetical protein [Candidatus Aenigmarchaeota archaeon]